MAFHIGCPPVQLSIERCFCFRLNGTPAPCAPQPIEKTATKVRRIEDPMHIGSHDSAVIGDCPFSSDVHFPEVLDIKERLDSPVANGSSHMHFIAFNVTSTRSMNPRHLNRNLLTP